MYVNDAITLEDTFQQEYVEQVRGRLHIQLLN